MRFAKRVGRAIDQRLRRRVVHESPNEFRRDESRGRGVIREQIEHFVAVMLAAAGFDVTAKYDFLALVVQLRHESEAAPLTRICNRPAGERARHLRHVLLRVAAIDAQRVQLEQLASIVFVQSLWSVLALLLDLLGTPWRETPQSGTARKTIWTERPLAGGRMRTVWIGAHPVVQIEQH